MADAQAPAQTQKGFLGWVEKTGNRLPDPVFIFFYLIAILVIASIIASVTGLTATLNENVMAGMSQSSLDRFSIGPDGIIPAISLLSPDNIQRLWVEMPSTFTHFHPLGYVLVVMLGAGVAERSGLFGSAMRAAVRGAPKFLLTPVVALVAMIGNHAADAAYVVLIPLAGVLFASAGRHPLAGIAAAFAGVSGGFSANIAPGQLDALLFGITEAAGEVLWADYDANIAGNWYFIFGMTIIFTPIIWFVTDFLIEPRLGKYSAEGTVHDAEMQDEDKPLTDGERIGIHRSVLAFLLVGTLWTVMTLWPWGTPLIDEAPDAIGPIGDRIQIFVFAMIICALLLAGWAVKRLGLMFTLAAILVALAVWNPAFLPDFVRFAEPHPDLVLFMSPLFRSLVAGFFILFLAAGWLYGSAAGTIKDKQDIVNMMSEAMKDMGYYLVLAFAAAHFVAMFNWSNLGLISAVHGADAIERSNLPLPLLLGAIVLFGATINLFVGSASAKWALLAPVLVPMLMLLNVSPEAATAAYRVGDSATNIITPLMVYFPLILIFCQRWQKDYGLGSLTAMMLPYSIWLLIFGFGLTVAWVYLGWPLGPGATVEFSLPTGP